jgi:hypothetical protein
VNYKGKKKVITCRFMFARVAAHVRWLVCALRATITGTGELLTKYDESEPMNVALIMLKPREPTTIASACTCATAAITASRTSSDSTQISDNFVNPAASKSLLAQSNRYLATA